MRTIWADHIAIDIRQDVRCGQWRALVNNNGVVIADIYGSLPAPSDDEIRLRAKRAIEVQATENIWS